MHMVTTPYFLLRRPSSRRIDPVWREWTSGAREDYEASLLPQRLTDGLEMADVVGHLRDTLPADAILTITVNPTRIVPKGPEIDFTAAHDRHRLVVA